MSSPPHTTLPLSSSPPKRPDIDPNASARVAHRSWTGSTGGGGDPPVHLPRHSPSLPRQYDPNDPEAQERQRTMDVDSAMQLSRARSASVAVPPAGLVSFLQAQKMSESPSDTPRRMSMEDRPDFQAFLDSHESENISGFGGSTSDIQHLSQAHEPSLLMSMDAPRPNEVPTGLPVYQQTPATYRSSFDFSLMEEFAEDEKQKLGLSSPTREPPSLLSPPLQPTPKGNSPSNTDLQQLSQDLFVPANVNSASNGTVTPDSSSTRMRQRRLSSSNPARPRRRQGGKMALFEGRDGPPPPTFGSLPAHSKPTWMASDVAVNVSANVAQGQQIQPPPPMYMPPPPNRTYRFSFYSNSHPSTIHACSLSELPAEGQSFEDLFCGLSSNCEHTDRDDLKASTSKTRATDTSASRRLNNRPGTGTEEACTWWLDVLSPTDDEMKLLSKVFSIHPLTTEDIQMEEIREKIELFPNYYLVCFRSFDQDPYSPTYLEPLNMYIVVFREGILSFHFRQTPHPQNVRRRIKQLKDYISVTSDWISYALIDDITDAFGPLIQNIEYEVDSIDELVLILKESEQSDMLRRIGTCRKKVMGLLRLMGNKADVVKGLAKRCNENWSVAPKSDIGLYLSDIQDHLITMTQNLNHYEKILSRSHSNYLAQISIEMTDANNQINDVLSKLTALGTVLIPMNLITGLWGMNVHVPGQEATGYAWFASIIGGLVGFALLGGFLTYRLMVRR